MLAHHHIAACTLHHITSILITVYRHSQGSHLHTTIQLLAQYHTAACTLPCNRLHVTMKPLAQCHTAVCTVPYSRLHNTLQLPGSHFPQRRESCHRSAIFQFQNCYYRRFHTTMQSLEHYHTAACTLPYSCLHTTMQPFAHYQAAACTLS